MHPGLYGNCSDLRGNCSDLRGDCTGLRGDLDEIPQTERPCALADWCDDAQESER
jgi:hypothetical protein